MVIHLDNNRDVRLEDLARLLDRLQVAWRASSRVTVRVPLPWEEPVNDALAHAGGV